MADASKIECDICQRAHHPKSLPFLCAVDGRNQLYEARLKCVQALIDNEAWQSKFNVTTPNTPSLSHIVDERASAEEATDEIRHASEQLRKDINDARHIVKERRAALDKRRRDLQIHRAREARQKPDVVERLEQSAAVYAKRWAFTADEMAKNRSFLCREAARLSGLKKSKGSVGKYSYYLGKIQVIDLTKMNSLEPELISASLANICHLLMLSAHYLSIRLPAQIVLPKKDHPRPTIFNLASSYEPPKPKPTAYGPGAAPLQASREDSTSGERPLFLTRPLSQLAKDDPPAYKSFLEGVTLLAYNVAWICTSQGISVSEKGTFEEICQMGRNLYNLLILQQPTAPSTPITTSDNEQQHPANGVGRYAHGSTYWALNSAEGEAMVRGAKLPPPLKLADKLRRKLMGDAPDWEVLEDDAWRVDDGIPVPDAQPKPESQGWMKVKSRT